MKAKRHIPILFTDPYQFWNRSLLTAFCIAMAIHLFAGLIFHVQLFKIVGSEKVFSPVEVIPQLLDMTGVETSLEREKQDSLWLKKPRGTKPQTPPIYIAFPESPIILHKGMENSSTLFSTLDLLDEKNYPILLDTLSNDQLKLTIHLSETLENRMNQLTINTLPHLTESHRYEIVVDNRSGEVIWFSALSDPNPELEKLLLTIQFNEVNDVAFSKGWIEFTSYYMAGIAARDGT